MTPEEKRARLRDIYKQLSDAEMDRIYSMAIRKLARQSRINRRARRRFLLEERARYERQKRIIRLVKLSSEETLKRVLAFVEERERQGYFKADHQPPAAPVEEPTARPRSRDERQDLYNSMSEGERAKVLTEGLSKIPPALVEVGTLEASQITTPAPGLYSLESENE